MVPTTFATIILSLSIGLLRTVFAQDLRTFAIQSGISTVAEADDDTTCTESKECKIGCCGPLDKSGKGVCGLGPDFCGEGCTSTCDYKSECDPGEFGFCGTTADFCHGVAVPSPECSGRTADQRTIGYYEGWNLQRPCGRMPPEDVPLGWYTHINFAFALIDPITFRIDPMDSETAKLYTRVTDLKKRQPELEVWIAIGGWAMNDPGPYRTTFSDLAKSIFMQDHFFESLITFMEDNGFDGVDLDWEYPVAEDRGGTKEDFDNYVTLIRRLRTRLNGTGKKYGLSITLPASYWYLKGFDIIKLEPYLDWYNIMTYDIHGVWDSTVESLGPYAYAHTNLTEIQMGLELLWRNNINPGRVVMGLGFYGRSFTMSSPTCMAPGCKFKDGAKGGECTGTPGVLSAAEINKILKRDDAKVTFDQAAGVKIVTWDTDQWVSWDDEETLKIKLEYANRRCLGGTMVWAIDLDDGTLIKALGSNLAREKELVFPEVPDYLVPDLGTGGYDEL
ncbi:hypothetical protein FQN54_002753 [Arachnomyces sp. PD_36]|nr:hypothetical protein FQN54_002753 [Arachnomyces sp. PD_36]